MLRDIFELALAYVQYLMLIVAIAPTSYQAFYRSPQDILKYINLDMSSILDEGNRGDNMFDVEIPDEIPMDSRLWFLVISVAVPLILNVVSLFILSGKKFFVWFLFIACGVLALTVGLFYLSRHDTWLSDRLPEFGAILMVVCGCIGIVIALAIIAGALWYIRRQEEIEKRKSGKLQQASAQADPNKARSKESADREASMSSPITKQQLLAAEEAKAGLAGNKNRNKKQLVPAELAYAGSNGGANGRQHRSAAAVSLPAEGPDGEVPTKTGSSLSMSAATKRAAAGEANADFATTASSTPSKDPRGHPSAAAAVTQGRGNHAMQREQSMFADETIERVFSEGLIQQHLLKQQQKIAKAEGADISPTNVNKEGAADASAEAAVQLATNDTNNSHLSKAAVKASYDLIMNRQVETLDFWATVTRGCYFVLFAFLGFYLSRVVNINDSIQNQTVLAREVLFGLGIVAFIFAAIAFVWFVLGFLRTGRVWQFRAEGLLRDNFVSALLLVISVLYIPAVNNVIIILNCQSIDCAPGTRLRDPRSLLAYASDSEYNVCEPCLVSSIPQSCPVNVSSLLCLASSGSRLRDDSSGVRCSDLQPYFWPAAIIVFFSFVVSVPLLNYLLTRVSTKHLDAEFPLDTRQVEGFSEEEVYREKVHLSDNVAKFIYDPFQKKYKHWRLLFIVQKLAIVVVSVFTFNVPNMSSEAFGITLSLVIHGLCFFINLAARPFNRKVENIFVIVTQFFLCVTCVIGLLATLGYDVPDEAGASSAILTYTIPVMALGLGAMLTFRDEMELELYRDDASRRARHNIKEIETDGGGLNTEGRPMDFAEEVKRGIAIGTEHLLDGDTVYSNDKAIELLANKDRMFLIERLSIEPTPSLSGSYGPLARYHAILAANPLLAAAKTQQQSLATGQTTGAASPANPPIGGGWQAISTGRNVSPAPKPNTPSIQANSGRAGPPNPPPLRNPPQVKSPTLVAKQHSDSGNYNTPKGNFNILGAGGATATPGGKQQHRQSPNQLSTIAPLVNPGAFVPPTLFPPTVNVAAAVASASGAITSPTGAAGGDLSISTSLSTSQRAGGAGPNIMRTNTTPPNNMARVVSPMSDRAKANWANVKRKSIGYVRGMKMNGGLASDDFLLDGAAGVGGGLTGGLGCSALGAAVAATELGSQNHLVHILSVQQQPKSTSAQVLLSPTTATNGNTAAFMGVGNDRSKGLLSAPTAANANQSITNSLAVLNNPGGGGDVITGEAMQTWDQLLVQLLQAGKKRRQQQLAAMREHQLKRKLSQQGSGFFSRKNSGKEKEVGAEGGGGTGNKKDYHFSKRRNRSIANQYADDEGEEFDGDDFDNPTNADRRRQQMQLRIHLKAIYERHLYKLVSQQRGVDFQINRSTISTLIVFLVFCGICSFVACTASVLGVLENEEGLRFVGATRQSSDLSATYQLLNYSSWQSFTSHCCCLPYSALKPSWPYRVVEGEKWVCDANNYDGAAELKDSFSSGVVTAPSSSLSIDSFYIKERFRVTYESSEYQNGLLVRPLCGLTFINGCQLAVNNITREVSIVGCNANVTTDAKLLF